MTHIKTFGLLFATTLATTIYFAPDNTNIKQNRSSALHATGANPYDSNELYIKTKPAPKPKIQATILLDVSNSMDGLIDQAKAQLWNMVNTMGKAKKDGEVPEIEIALYEYGRPANGSANGYIKQISPFGSNLDELSVKLFGLVTNGGDEYCSEVISTSLTELKWDERKDVYKVIFIAGNEEFIQGNVTYTQACAKATAMGVIVNTIYCGNRLQGIKEHWNMGAECGNGSFTNINQDAVVEDAVTPYDDILYSLNKKLNTTYMSYGANGNAAMEQVASVDKMNYEKNKSSAAKRVMTKGQEVYNNKQWDAVDAQKADKEFYKKVDLKTLPAPLQNKTRAEINTIIQGKTAERNSLQKEIAETGAKRAAFLTDAMSKDGKAKVETLESAIQRIIVEQGSRFNLKF